MLCDLDRLDLVGGADFMYNVYIIYVYKCMVRMCRVFFYDRDGGLARCYQLQDQLP